MATKTFKIGLSAAEKAAMASSTLTTLLGMCFETYSSSSTYEQGEFVVYDNTLYRCTTNITTPEAWNASHWETAKIGDLADDVNESVKKNVITDLEENKEYAYQILINSNGELILRLTEIA